MFESRDPYLLGLAFFNIPTPLILSFPLQLPPSLSLSPVFSLFERFGEEALVKSLLEVAVIIQRSDRLFQTVGCMVCNIFSWIE